MRKIKKIMMVAMSMILVAGMVMPLHAAGKVTVKASGTATPAYQYGQEKELKLTITNGTDTAIENVVVTPQVKANIEKWPFEIENVSYEQKVDKIEAGKSYELTYDVKAREDVASKYYNVKFDVSYDGLENAFEQSVFVKMTAKPEEKPQEKPEEKPQTDPQPQQPSADTGISNSEPMVYSGGDSGDSGSATTSTSVPRVIVTGFSTDPAEVKAGSNFKLIVHLKNTSKTTAVKNMLFDFNAPTEGQDANTASPAFLPASGSSTVYLDGIGANGTKDISIDMNAKSDLVQKPYSVEMSMKYEDGSGTQFESTSSISVPVKQDARFEFSEFELSGETVEVGSEVNVMCSLYNMGRIKLYNVKAKFEGEGIKSKEIFVGNVESGATASIDGMITGESETTGDGKVKMVVTYEDESGAVFTAEKELTLLVTAPMTDDMMMNESEMVEQEKAFPIIPVIVGVIIIGVIVVVVIVKKKKEKKRRAEEEEILEDELNRLTENE